MENKKIKALLFFITGLIFLLGVQGISAEQLDSSASKKNSLIQTALNHREMYVFVDVKKDTLLDMYLITNGFISDNQLFQSPFGTQIICIDTNNSNAFNSSTIEIVKLENVDNSNSFNLEIRFYISTFLATVNFFIYEYDPLYNQWLLRKYRKVQT